MFDPAFTKQDIASLNARFAAEAVRRNLETEKQLAFEEGAFFALEAIARHLGERPNPRKPIATAADYARLDALVCGNKNP